MIQLKLLDFIKDLELIAPLMIASHQESADSRVPLRLDMPQYLEAQLEGKLISVGAFVGDKLCAFTVFSLTPMNHHADTLHAISEIFYVQPAYRHTPVLKRLLDVVEHQAELKGVARVLIGSRKRSAYFERIGYSETEITYQKFIGKVAEGE